MRMKLINELRHNLVSCIIRGPSYVTKVVNIVECDQNYRGTSYVMEVPLSMTFVLSNVT